MTASELMSDSNSTPGRTPQPEPGIRLTENSSARADRARSRSRWRSACLVILFYIVTLVKGPGVLERPL